MKSKLILILLSAISIFFLFGCLKNTDEEKTLVFKTASGSTTNPAITTSITILFKQTTVLDYNSDFSGEIEVTNNSNQNIVGWTLEFESTIPFLTVYDVVIVSLTPKIKITNKDYNKTIPANGGKTNLPFDATGIPSTDIIKNAKFNGVSLICPFILKPLK